MSDTKFSAWPKVLAQITVDNEIAWYSGKSRLWKLTKVPLRAK